MQKTDVHNFSLHLTDTGKSSNTVRTYKYRVLQFLEWCKHQEIRPARATKAHLEEYLSMAKRQPKGATKATNVAALRAFFQWLIADGRRRTDPTKGIPAGGRGSKPSKPYSPDQLNRLLDATLAERDRALILVCLCSGAKRSDLLNLRIEDIDWASARLQLGSAGSTRLVKLDQRALKSIKDYVGARHEGWVWLAEHGGRLSEHGASTRLLAIGKRAGVERANWHRFRVTFIANEEGNDDTRHLQEVLGLTSVEFKSARGYASRFGDVESDSSAQE